MFSVSFAGDNGDSRVKLSFEMPAAPRLVIRRRSLASGEASRNVFSQSRRLARGSLGTGTVSSTSPPPIVRAGDSCRRTKRSSGRRTTGCASFTFARAVSPGCKDYDSYKEILAGTAEVNA